MSVEQTIKNQYSKHFTVEDWPSFKAMADYYFKKAALLKKQDVPTDCLPELLIRNVQKRLFIGVGAELLVKAFLLKNGYGINTPKHGTWRAQKIGNLPVNQFEASNTVTLNAILQEIETERVTEFAKSPQIIRGLKIAKVFRNKEGHVVTKRHEYNPENYSDIEIALQDFYRLYFEEKLDFQISMESNQQGRFQIENH